jgi:hypothetical protein
MISLVEKGFGELLMEENGIAAYELGWGLLSE